MSDWLAFMVNSKEQKIKTRNIELLVHKSWISDIIEDFSIDDLPDQYQLMAELIGIEKTLELSVLLGGMKFYYRHIEHLLADKRNRRIRAEFTGANYVELARKYDLSTTWIRFILRKNP